ncbi:glycine-rich RNA-binding protein 4, mitochondrial-like protein, partial [Tanacetum coccineum]
MISPATIQPPGWRVCRPAEVVAERTKNEWDKEKSRDREAKDIDREKSRDREAKDIEREKSHEREVQDKDRERSRDREVKERIMEKAAIKRIMYDKDSGRSRGFGFVNFSTKDEATLAKDAMH